MRVAWVWNIRGLELAIDLRQWLLGGNFVGALGMWNLFLGPFRVGKAPAGLKPVLKPKKPICAHP